MCISGILLILILAGCLPAPSTFAAPTPADTITSTVPTDIATPTRIPCFLCLVITDLNEITFCSSNPSQPAGVRVIARWLAQPGKKGFYVAAQNSMDVSSVRFFGWNSRMEGQQIGFIKSTEDSEICGYPATWNRWFDLNTTNPIVGSKVTVDFLGSDSEVVVTINLTVAESGLILDNMDYHP
jgi:hypothetical protein